jgi:hypothetical protein
MPGPPIFSSPRLLWPIAAALVLWGLFLALGLYLFHPDHDLRRPAILLASVGAFLTFWTLMFLNRRRRMQSR